MWPLWVFFISSLICSRCLSEYRVFQLKITGAKPQDVRLVKSNLDPEQYPTYYPLKNEEKISYTSTWMCPGRTGGGRDICPNPKEKPPEKTEEKKSETKQEANISPKNDQ